MVQLVLMNTLFFLFPVFISGEQVANPSFYVSFGE